MIHTTLAPTTTYRAPVDLSFEEAMRARHWMARNPLALLAGDTFSPTEIRRLIFQSWLHSQEQRPC